MPSAEKMKLKKELEKFHAPVKGWKRDDLVLGRWFVQFLERTLGAQTSAVTPKDVREKWKGCDGNDELADDITSSTIHEAIAVTDAVQEHLTPTEVKNFKDKKPGGEQRITGDAVALVAELLYATKLNVELMFNVAAAYEKKLDASQWDLFIEAFARALGSLDYEAAKESGGNIAEQVGAQVFARAIAQTVGSSLSDAQRKGFYCYYAKAIAKETAHLVEALPRWEPPKVEDPAAAMGGMMSGNPDEEPAAY